MIKHFAEVKCINGESLLLKGTFLVAFLMKFLKEILNDDKFTDHGETRTSDLRN